ncbi:MAG TPA: DUF3754 domain-containing protein [Candidatus Hydrogenedentes bacterium]|nr:DUF3754 domain-containing protein [Candidatus Hydrogenedentota bacterium]
MTEQISVERFRFIPYRKHDILEMCLEDKRLQGQEERFRYLYRLLDCTFHYEFHQIVERMKDAYAGIDPDADTNHYGKDGADGNTQFFDLLESLLEKANYERVTDEDLKQALTESSLFKIRLRVDFDDFDEMKLFYRGVSERQATVPGWMGFGSKTIDFINYDRVVLYIRFSEQHQREHAKHHLFRTGSSLLKMFRNVPKADLEMLFPNTSVRMRTLDTLLIGIPALGGGIAAVWKLTPAIFFLGSLLGYWLGTSEERPVVNNTMLVAFLVGLTALAGYLWKQFNSFKNRKLKFMQELTRNLYFRNMDNNAGVFYRIANDAEEEECKEALLAYYFLLVSGHPMTPSELDRGIERWMATGWNCEVDFEIDDALQKLMRLELVQEKNGLLTAVSVETAIRKLDERWDAIFSPAS